MNAVSPNAPPRVSVIMATWNWSSFLPYSIGSVLRQDYSDFELLVVGDACTDGSEQEVRAFGDPRVRWINLAERHGHQAGPNNEGLRQARGALIAYLGHDDLWLPHHLSVLVAAIDGGADLAWGIARMVAPTDPELDGAHAVAAFRPGMWLPPSSVVHRKALSDRAGGWRDYRELDCDPDTEIWARLHAHGARMQPVPRLTVVKFPAAARRDVYREKPCHEQAAWSARIAREADFEAVELAGTLMTEKARPRVKPYRALLAELASRTVRGAVRRLLPRDARRRQQLFFERRRRFKGAPPPGGE
ncbi:glycosyltransferase [Sphingomonas bacterium]|uniref:glycosyltransferase family 2 protein n=1 Tax=Sphingomonas bacterium TaxID=1895847 RepID=UPI002636B34B|nr:glycosyltransferase [Sphingomonas bacterium]